MNYGSLKGNTITSSLMSHFVLLSGIPRTSKKKIEPLIRGPCASMQQVQKRLPAQIFKINCSKLILSSCRRNFAIYKYQDLRAFYQN